MMMMSRNAMRGDLRGERDRVNQGSKRKRPAPRDAGRGGVSR
jgi:hypothetical protein